MSSQKDLSKLSWKHSYIPKEQASGSSHSCLSSRHRSTATVGLSCGVELSFAIPETAYAERKQVFYLLEKLNHKSWQTRERWWSICLTSGALLNLLNESNMQEMMNFGSDLKDSVVGRKRKIRWNPGACLRVIEVRSKENNYQRKRKRNLKRKKYELKGH